MAEQRNPIWSPKPGDIIRREDKVYVLVDWADPRQLGFTRSDGTEAGVVYRNTWSMRECSAQSPKQATVCRRAEEGWPWDGNSPSIEDSRAFLSSWMAEWPKSAAFSKMVAEDAEKKERAEWKARAARRRWFKGILNGPRLPAGEDGMLVGAAEVRGEAEAMYNMTEKVYPTPNMTPELRECVIKCVQNFLVQVRAQK